MFRWVPGAKSVSTVFEWRNNLLHVSRLPTSRTPWFSEDFWRVSSITVSSASWPPSKVPSCFLKSQIIQSFLIQPTPWWPLQERHTAFKLHTSNRTSECKIRRHGSWLWNRYSFPSSLRSEVRLTVSADYRRIPRALSKVYYHPLTPSNTLEIGKIFKSFTSQDPNDPPISNRALSIWGRTLLVPESTTKVAKFHFHDLCGKPLSAADYLEVTKTFGTVFVLDIPKMGMDRKDLVRQMVLPYISSAHGMFTRHRHEDSSLSSMHVMRAGSVIVMFSMYSPLVSDVIPDKTLCYLRSSCNSSLCRRWRFVGF
jgi:hypothetical protein